MGESQSIMGYKDGWGVNQSQPILTGEVESYLDDVDPDYVAQTHSQPIWSAEVKSHTWRPKLIQKYTKANKNSNGGEILTQNGTKVNSNGQTFHTSGITPL